MKRLIKTVIKYGPIIYPIVRKIIKQRKNDKGKTR
ncbi:hypothetical protein P5G51_008205 [Virgibacillus sp. 179-BFC.A HS]|uniref:YqzE family protein n=1 Tax=Tigheibacillus jepli TaxID=3035914 RepID=A0ABU5CIN2_9BACI|nr:hypothetical protein [Virgibacillus sp. 179-BFC.A HS]MDY0405383.1 hypothetical protein [Virgibacillus sp. 179-BFC.A HS]